MNGNAVQIILKGVPSPERTLGGKQKSNNTINNNYIHIYIFLEHSIVAPEAQATDRAVEVVGGHMAVGGHMDKEVGRRLQQN